MIGSSNCDKNSNSGRKISLRTDNESPSTSSASTSTPRKALTRLFNIFSGFRLFNTGATNESDNQNLGNEGDIQAHASTMPPSALSPGRSRKYQFRLAAQNESFIPTDPSTQLTSGHVVVPNSLVVEPVETFDKPREQRAEPVGSSVSCSGACRLKMHDIKYLNNRLKKCQEDLKQHGDMTSFNSQLNEIYLQRLYDIEKKADGDLDTKLVTYQEWADMLLQINAVMIRDMEGLECEVGKRLKISEQRICETEEDNEKYRRDIHLLMKLLYNGYHHGTWNMRGMKFQTIDPTHFLDGDFKHIDTTASADSSERGN